MREKLYVKPLQILVDNGSTIKRLCFKIYEFNNDYSSTSQNFPRTQPTECVLYHVNGIQLNTQGLYSCELILDRTEYQIKSLVC